jgi:hypothetical protein
MLKPNIYTRQQFDHFIASVRPEFLKLKDFFMVAEFNGDVVEVKFVERLVTTTAPTPAPEPVKVITAADTVTSSSGSVTTVTSTNLKPATTTRRKK